MSVEILITTAEEIGIAPEIISTWPIWTCEISDFDWFYDEKELCLILEGEIIVSTATEEVHIYAGDFVVFPAGLSCRWKVLKPVKKHYFFG
ncbi:MAG: cupin domain-containing protein [Fidelibacterota bacterium]